MTDTPEAQGWKWLKPNKSYVWVHVRGKWRLCIFVAVTAWDGERPRTVSVNDVGRLIRNEHQSPYTVRFNRVHALRKPATRNPATSGGF